MTDTIFLLVRATIRTSHKSVQDAICEVQQKASITVSDTKKVKIDQLQFMDYKPKRT